MRDIWCEIRFIIGDTLEILALAIFVTFVYILATWAGG